jgi:hypothetical protein
MLAIKEGDDEKKRGGQKKGFFADVLRILEAQESLPRILDWKGVNVSEFGVIHEVASD